MGKPYSIDYWKSFVGKKINSLTIIDYVQRDNKIKSYFLCKCECGKTVELQASKVVSGHNKSCGCYLGKRNPNTHHFGGTRLYSIWRHTITRCYDTKSDHYHIYGARGITVCDEWKTDFLSFREWALNSGYNDELSIDRIDVNGNYCPENCRWATRKEQQRNMRNNRYVTYRGETKLLVEWCEELNLPQEIMRTRLNLWGEQQAERIFNQPIVRKKKHKI